MDNQKKTFFCADCHHVFMAFENDTVVCPKCQSDNIRLKKQSTIPTFLPKLGVGIVAALIGFFATKTLLTGHFESLPDGNGVTSSGGVIEIPIDNVDIPSGVINEPEPNTEDEEKIGSNKPDEIPEGIEQKVVTSFMQPTQVDYIYSFQAKCNLDGKEDILYELMETSDGEVIQTSKNGLFVNLKPRKTGYYFRVRVVKTGFLSESKLVTGFIPKPAMIEQKMPGSELESLINSQQASSDKSGKIAKNIVIAFTNKTSEDHYSNLQDVENEILFNNWSSVKVVSVEYNDRGQISKVMLEIIK